MKTDLTLGIQNPCKTQDIIVQTKAHVATDIKIADIEMTPSREQSKKLLPSIQSVPKKTISPKIINLSKYKLKKPELSLLRKRLKLLQKEIF